MSLFEQFFADVEHDTGFLKAHAIHDFTFEVEGRMEKLGVTQAELARRLGTSRAYVTKMLRGNANFTIESMVKIAHALEARVHIRVEPGSCGERLPFDAWGEIARGQVGRPVPAAWYSADEYVADRPVAAPAQEAPYEPAAAA